MRIPPAFLLWSLSAFAQQPEPEIRGTIYERGSDTPIAGVEVRLFEFGPNEQNFIVRKLVVGGFTGNDGVVSLKPGHLGEFMLEAIKTGYRQTGGPSATLTAESPIQVVRLSLVRPGSLTGRIVDSDGNPLANFPLDIETVDRRSRIGASTDPDGYFVKEVEPGSYLVSVGPPLGMTGRDELVEYSESEFDKIDEDVEPSYWPGGIADREGVLPVPVAGGGRANVGTITVRKTRYYRVHVSLADECAPNERWIYRILTEPRELISNPEQFGGCRKEFLLTGLRPGSHTLAVWVGREVRKWGLIKFTIANRNIEAALRLTPSIGVSGQVKAAEGHKLEELGPVQVLLRPEQGLGAVRPDGPADANGMFKVEASGMFKYETVAWPQQLLSVEVRGPGTYVKEIRYNGLPVRSPRVDMAQGSGFEILLDSGAAALTGKIEGYGELFVVRDGFEPFTIARIPPFQFMGGHRAGESSFTITNLPPGSYRVMVVGRDFEDQMVSPEELAARLARAQKITVEANERKQIDVRQ